MALGFGQSDDGNNERFGTDYRHEPWPNTGHGEPLPPAAKMLEVDVYGAGL
jgi:hypothetical protein